ncbi:hypothetical protein [Candidatus Borrarchaeum sp.]|uniref:hypothetical protein n=1 Tax=Candidatus Borrarchaeum sp. TaxID=2846742 RepID=UPI002579B03F|nr:hypothetical protein [Candidatus Borrarchaeum sp.]
MSLSRFKSIIWRFFKDKVGQMQAVDFAIALSIFLIAFSQVLGMAINSTTAITEQTTQDHVYIAGSTLSNYILTNDGGFDWDDTSSSNLEHANGYALGLANETDSPAYTLHPNALARLDPESKYYLPIIDETQYGIQDPYYDSAYHEYIHPTDDFNAHSALNIPYGERFYFGLHSLIRLNLNYTLDPLTDQLTLTTWVTDNGQNLTNSKVSNIRHYLIDSQGSVRISRSSSDAVITDTIDLTGRPYGYYAYVGRVETTGGNFDFRYTIIDFNADTIDYSTLKVNTTLLERSSRDGELHLWWDGESGDIHANYTVIRPDGSTAESSLHVNNHSMYEDLDSLGANNPVMVVVRAYDDNQNHAVTFTALPLLFDSDVRPTHQSDLTHEYIRSIYGISPTEGAVYTEYIHKYVSVRGMVFEATVCYWRR